MLCTVDTLEFGQAAYQALFPEATVSISVGKLLDDRLFQADVSGGPPHDDVPQDGGDPPRRAAGRWRSLAAAILHWPQQR